jgi:prepilin-type N-terminal cleavage/methylation domain-containing protein
MKKQQGFTLVELLVVMAIISILAAIAIPNVQKWIEKGKATQAIAEINGIELALTKLLSDCGRSGLSDLYNMKALELDFGTYETWDADDFADIQRILSDTTIALLRGGRGAFTTDNYISNTVDPDTNAAVSLIREDVIQNMGTSYMAELGLDPWGNLYQIFPGPWPTRYGLNVFRTYLAPANGVRLPGDPTGPTDDDLSLEHDGSNVILIDDATGDPMDGFIGLPASTKMNAYIWSYGANLVSGQARYSPPSVGYNPNDLTNYESGQEPELMGGGDDINNWDRNQTFMRFYN